MRRPDLRPQPETNQVTERDCGGGQRGERGGTRGRRAKKKGGPPRAAGPRPVARAEAAGERLRRVDGPCAAPPGRPAPALARAPPGPDALRALARDLAAADRLGCAPRSADAARPGRGRRAAGEAEGGRARRLTPAGREAERDGTLSSAQDPVVAAGTDTRCTRARGPVTASRPRRPDLGEIDSAPRTPAAAFCGFRGPPPRWATPPLLILSGPNRPRQVPSVRPLPLFPPL